MVLCIAAASRKEGLHTVPNLNAVGARVFEALKWDEADETCCMIGRIDKVLRAQGIYECTDRNVWIVIAVIGLRKQLD